jgi:DNA-binding FrmR family transcriptional regulator
VAGQQNLEEKTPRVAAPHGTGDSAAAPDAMLGRPLRGTTPGRGLDLGAVADAGAIPSTFRHAYSQDQAVLIRRLRRIEGQVRGIERMIERKEYCVDILQQTAALRAAVDSVSLLILEDHVQGCVRTAAEQGDADKYIEEVLDVVRRSMGKPVRSRA